MERPNNGNSTTDSVPQYELWERNHGRGVGADNKKRGYKLTEKPTLMWDRVPHACPDAQP